MIFIIDFNVIFQIFSLFFETKTRFIIYFNVMSYKIFIVNLLKHISEKDYIKSSHCRRIIFFNDLHFHITI